MTFTATYDPADDKLRLYASARLDAATYERAKKLGFRWAPRQDLFFAMWHPLAEDFCTELTGEIEDEDKTLVERAEERSDRFEGYSDQRKTEAESAHKAVSAIADGIPLGQPILVGHHSEKRARKDAERIASGMRKAVKLWDTSAYWQDRAAGAMRSAKYKERPDVRSRRIKTIEAALRKVTKESKEAAAYLRLWSDLSLVHRKDGKPMTDHDRARSLSNFDHISMYFTLAEYPRDPPASQYEGEMGLWSALTGGVITAEQARALAIPAHERTIERCARWISHYENRLVYERALLQEAGGTVADRMGPEVGGGVRCWCSLNFGRGWSYVQKVNKVTVTVLDNHGNGGRNFTRTIKFDELKAVMSRADVDAARLAGRLREDRDLIGFFLLDEPPPEIKISPKLADGTSIEQAAEVARMREVLREGVKIAVVPQLFPTPPELAARLVEMTEIRPDHRVLEPSAGTGALLAGIHETRDIVAVEVKHELAAALRAKFPGAMVFCADFLTDCGNDLATSRVNLQTFDRIVMNPPFAGHQDIDHVTHALDFLKEDGILVAIMSAGVRFRQDRKAMEFRSLMDALGAEWEDLPPGSFSEAGTEVRACIVKVPA